MLFLDDSVARWVVTSSASEEGRQRVMTRYLNVARDSVLSLVETNAPLAAQNLETLKLTTQACFGLGVCFLLLSQDRSPIATLEL